MKQSFKRNGEVTSIDKGKIRIIMETSDERRNGSAGTESVTFEEIRQMQRNNELRAERDRIEQQRRSEELDRRMAETAQFMKEQWKEAREFIAELRESNKELRERQMETSRHIEETNRQMKETDRKFKQMYNQFTTQWGHVLEEVTKPSALKLFKEIGIDIDHIFQESMHRKEEDREMEADIILVNTTAVVVVEVKTTLRTDDVDYFLKKMGEFKRLFKEFKDKTVYVAVAAIKFNNSSDIYAKKNGIFVLRSNSDHIYKLENIPEEKRRKF